MECEVHKLSVRDATLDDLPAIVAIYNSAIAAGVSVADVVPISVESRLQWFHEHSSDRRPLWVLEQHGIVAAWIGLQSYSPQPAFQRTAEVSVYIAREYQNKGIGTALLRRLLERCPTLGVDVVMGVMFGNNVATIKMNKKLGFEHWGRLRRVAELSGELRDLVIMGVDLRDRVAQVER